MYWTAADLKVTHYKAHCICNIDWPIMCLWYAIICDLNIAIEYIARHFFHSKEIFMQLSHIHYVHIYTHNNIIYIIYAHIHNNTHTHTQIYMYNNIPVFHGQPLIVLSLVVLHNQHQLYH